MRRTDPDGAPRHKKTAAVPENRSRRQSQAITKIKY